MYLYLFLSEYVYILVLGYSKLPHKKFKGIHIF